MSQTYAVTAVDGVAFGLLLFVVASGLALIFGVMEVLNLAHGTLYLLGAYLTYLTSDGSLLGLAVAVAVGLLAGAVAGAVLATGMQPLTGRGHLDQALATIGVAFIAADIFNSAFGPSPLPADPPTALTGRASMFGHGYPVYRLGFIGVAAIVAVALHLVMRHTTAGLRLRACVSDPGMAAAAGIPVARVRLAAMAVGGALAVGAGALGAPLLGPAPGVDTTVLVLSLIVVVLGGAGSVPATLAAALLVGQVQTIGVLTAPALAPFALFSALLLVLVIRGMTSGRTLGRPA
ncbi:MAG: branched-chain amino acid ABC transporter permease [Dermatophilaceae bacterium]